MGFLRFFKRKKKEEEIVKPEKPKEEEVPKKEFPEISQKDKENNIAKHVAIVDGKIVASANTAKQVLTIAKKKYPDKKIEIRFVAGKRLLLKCKCLERTKLKKLG